MLTGWVGGTGAAVAQLPAVTLPAVADAEAAPASAGEGCAGFSLPELLAALAAYSVLLTVALHLFPALHRGAEGAIRQLQLMRQLDLYALNMVKDLRRAGFSPQGKAGRALWIGRYLREPAGSCLVVGYAYYARSDASGHLVTATFGYRLRRGALETQRDVSDCQGGGWEKVFNSDELTVTRLQFTALAGGALRIHLAATVRRRPDIGYAVTQVVARRNL